jgi:DNA-binding CsgD family transcriptional regulator
MALLDFKEDMLRLWSSQDYAQRVPSDFGFLKAQQALNMLFSVGDYYDFLFNVQTGILEHVGASVERVMGYPARDYSMEFFLSLIHPEDMASFIRNEDTVLRFLQTLDSEQIFRYKMRYDYRVRRADGSYARLLHQAVAVEVDENNTVVRSIGVHTDISHLKMTGPSVLSFIGLDGHPSYENVHASSRLPQWQSPHEERLTAKPLFSKREREVLEWVVLGTTSKDIADKLFISVQTVDTHRKRILAKAGVRNTAGLVKAAVEQGWI